MIPRLRRRLMLLVVGVLVLVTAGIVLSINAMNLRNISAEAESALALLAENAGERPLPPDLRDDDARRKPERLRDGRRFPSDPSGPGGFAALSSFYTIRLDAEGAFSGWSSDRAGLYTEDEVRAVADAVAAQGRRSGRVDAQYYRLAEADGESLVIVLDARLEFLSARRALRATALVAGLACVLLSAAACLLIARMLRPVEQSFERQKQFVWDASHELKTPLAVISANAEVLAADVGENEYLGYILSEVRRTDRLVQNLLTLARMDRGTVKAELKRLDLSEALMSVALPFESTVFEAGRTLELDVPEGVFIKGDGDMLRQLAVILLSNALKYSDEGGTIRLSLARKGHAAALTVFNTGAGIPADQLEKVFDRFYRGDGSHSGEVAGNGLGLSIARTIAEAHKGTIRAESVPGESATFIVTLPA